MNLFIVIIFAAILVSVLLTRSKVEDEFKELKNDRRSTTKSTTKGKRQ